MSLKSKITGNDPADKEFQRIVRQALPSKTGFRTLSGNNPFTTQCSCQAPYTLSKSYYASVVGTAFDYVARIIIAGKITDNKDSVFSNLVAAGGLRTLQHTVGGKEFRRLNDKYDDAIKILKSYVYKKEGDIEDLLSHACFLARLEHINRSGMPPQDIQKSLLGREEDEILADLFKLCDMFITKFINNSLINSKSTVVFNPRFGLASICCGGADADIYVDGTLYDFKTSKTNAYSWKEAAQIVGYYLLNRVSVLIDDVTASLLNYPIERLAMYRARYGEIEFVEITDLNPDLIEQATEELKTYFGLVSA